MKKECLEIVTENVRVYLEMSGKCLSFDPKNDQIFRPNFFWWFEYPENIRNMWEFFFRFFSIWKMSGICMIFPGFFSIWKMSGIRMFFPVFSIRKMSGIRMNFLNIFFEYKLVPNNILGNIDHIMGQIDRQIIN